MEIGQNLIHKVGGEDIPVTVRSVTVCVMALAGCSEPTRNRVQLDSTEI